MVESPFLDNRERVLESSVGFVIYDKYPVNEGHCLIIPHRVYSNYFDSSNEEIEGLNQLLFDTKKILDGKYSPKSLAKPRREEKGSINGRTIQETINEALRQCFEG
jgi:hypothetical protein